MLEFIWEVNKVKEFDEQINDVYQKGSEQLKVSQHEKQLMKLIKSSGTGTKGMGMLGDDMDTIKISIKGAPRKSILMNNVLK